MVIDVLDKCWTASGDVLTGWLLLVKSSIFNSFIISRQQVVSIWRLGCVCLSLFPGRRVSAMWRDALWTVGGSEFFLETFIEWSKTPVIMLRLRLGSLFCTFLIIFIALMKDNCSLLTSR